MMRFILAKLESSASASELLKSVNVLHAIRKLGRMLLKSLSRNVSVRLASWPPISHLYSVESLVRVADLDQQQSDDNDDEDELSALFHRVQGSENCCSVSEMLSVESEVPVCAEFDEASRDEEFMAELGPQDKEPCLSDEEDCNLDVPDPEPPPPKLQSLRECMDCLKDVRSFLELNGYMTEATKTEELVNAVAGLHCSNTKYTFHYKLLSAYRHCVIYLTYLYLSIA